MSEIFYKNKYIKYRSKYLKIKKGGTDDPKPPLKMSDLDENAMSIINEFSSDDLFYQLQIMKIFGLEMKKKVILINNSYSFNRLIELINNNSDTVISIEILIFEDHNFLQSLIKEDIAIKINSLNVKSFIFINLINDDYYDPDNFYIDTILKNKELDNLLILNSKINNKLPDSLKVKNKLYINNINDINLNNIITNNLIHLNLKCNSYNNSLEVYFPKLIKLKNLKILHLSNFVSDISFLSQLTNIEDLSLTNIDLSLTKNELNLTFLSELTNLKKLKLSSNKIINMEILNSLTKLEELVIISLDEQDLNNINELINLKKLNLSKNKNKIININVLNSLINLEELRLDSIKFDDNDLLINLTELNKLKILDISNINSTGDKIMNYSYLNTLTNIEKLNLSNNNIQEEDINILFGENSNLLEQLKVLILDKNTITINILNLISRCKKLEILKLKNLTNWRDDEDILEELQKLIDNVDNFKSLKHLDIRGNGRFEINEENINEKKRDILILQEKHPQRRNAGESFCFIDVKDYLNILNIDVVINDPRFKGLSFYDLDDIVAVF